MLLGITFATVLLVTVLLTIVVTLRAMRPVAMIDRNHRRLITAETPVTAHAANRLQDRDRHGS
jgi:hypothetical protein